MLASRDLYFAGRRVRVLDSGGGSPAVFFLHNNSGSGELFRPLLGEKLTERYRCIAVDFPGHGASEPSLNTENYSVPALAALVAALIVELAPGPCVLVGHSLGGHVAAAALPSIPNLAGLFLISAPPINNAFMASAFAADPTTGAMFAGALSVEQEHRFRLALLGRKPISSDVEEMLTTAIRTTDVAFRPALLASIVGGRLADERANVENTALPTCLVFGERDLFLQTSYLREFPLRNGRVHAIEGSGHCPHLDATSRVGELLRDYLDIALACPIAATGN